jgi:ribosomal protein L11
MDFVKAYNAATEAQVGTVIPVEICSRIALTFVSRRRRRPFCP